MRAGEVFGRRKLKDETRLVLRAPRARDLEEMMRFVNTLVSERRVDPSLGILMDKRIGLREEEKFLADILAGMRKDDVVDVVAEADGMIVANSSVQRMRSGDVRHVGRLSIAILEGYRSVGLGRIMMKILLQRAEMIGIRLVTLEAFGNNERALRLYLSLGFREFGRLPKAIHRGRDWVDLVHMFRQA